ncbi:MAG: hypothetical protein SFX73_24700 [Kofleriaceae bacterium]|nr:hypothetical protein [Kofleriaceae bacterium]
MNSDIITRAIAAYCRRREGISEQPSMALTEVEGDQIVLHNCNGELGRYRITRGGGLRWIKVKS